MAMTMIMMSIKVAVERYLLSYQYHSKTAVDRLQWYALVLLFIF
jgi:hypothetical protein